MDQVTITRRGSDAEGEYRAEIAGAADAGVLVWSQAGGIRTAHSTRVPPSLRGKGIAAALVDALVADARAQGFRIDPACSYVEAAFARHPEWAALRA